MSTAPPWSDVDLKALISGKSYGRLLATVQSTYPDLAAQAESDLSHWFVSSLKLIKIILIKSSGYFLLGDSLNTTVTVVATLQNTVVEYDTLTLTYLLLVGIAAQAIGIYSFWRVQQRFRLGTKTMFNTVAMGIILL